MNNDNYQKMIGYKTGKLCESTLPRDKLQLEIHEVNIMLRDSILFNKDFLKFADERNFSEDTKIDSVLKIGQAYRSICLKNQKNVEANLKNSLPFVQRFVRTLQNNPELHKSCNFLPDESIFRGLPDEIWTEIILRKMDDFAYIKKFRYYHP